MMGVKNYTNETRKDLINRVVAPLIPMDEVIIPMSLSSVPVDNESYQVFMDLQENINQLKIQVSELSQIINVISLEEMCDRRKLNTDHGNNF